MNKELIIIVYKMKGMTPYEFDNLSAKFTLSKDEELKENYIIREIFIPTDGESDVKIIYPVSQYSIDSDFIEELSNLISDRILDKKTEPLYELANEITNKITTRSAM